MYNDFHPVNFPLDLPWDGLPNAAPLPPRLVAGPVGAIVLNFKLHPDDLSKAIA